MTDTVLNLNLSNRYEIQKRKRYMRVSSQLTAIAIYHKLHIIRKTWMSNEIQSLLGLRDRMRFRWRKRTYV